MMEEAGRIIEVRAGRALVQTERSGACGRCAAKAGCAPLGEGRQARIWAADCVGVERGEKVVVEIPEKSLLTAAVLGWFVSAALLAAGAWAGTRVGPRWGYSRAAAGVVAGCGALALSLAAMKLSARRRLKGPRIVRKVEDG